ncbi:MAG TPA: hypothetical protein VGH79_10265 [Gaiellaceae bacterium]|jgi:hypothetical protein
MRRILLLLVAVAILALPAAAAARPKTPLAVGFLVVHNASTDGGITGRPVATVAVQGFVIGHIGEQGRVEIYHYSGSTSGAQVSGNDLSREPVFYHGQSGTKYTGSDFRFRAVGGVWRVVVYGAGVSLYAGGVFRKVSLHGSVYGGKDGHYAFDGGRFRSMPEGVVTRRMRAT